MSSKEKKPILKNAIVGVKVSNDNRCSRDCPYMLSSLVDNFCGLLGIHNTVLLKADSIGSLKRTRVCMLKEVKIKQRK